MNFDALRIAYFQASRQPFRNIKKNDKTAQKVSVKFSVSICLHLIY